MSWCQGPWEGVPWEGQLWEKGRIREGKEWGPRVSLRVGTSMGFTLPLNGHRGEKMPEDKGELDFSSLLQKR